jgi:multidrug efflux pump
LYESLSTLWAVILVVPMRLLSALVGLALAGMDVNIFVQVGFVVLVGLAAKNAILIVQFARDRQHEGASGFDAAVDAARERLRPILMTSFAFILGVFPLVIAEGAGAEMLGTLGMAVFAGMIGVTVFGLFLTPVFYYVVGWFAERKVPAPAPAAVQAPAAAAGIRANGQGGRTPGSVEDLGFEHDCRDQPLVRQWNYTNSTSTDASGRGNFAEKARQPTSGTHKALT